MVILQLKKSIFSLKEFIFTFVSKATIIALLVGAFFFVLLCMAGWWFSFEDIMSWFYQKTGFHFEKRAAYSSSR